MGFFDRDVFDFNGDGKTDGFETYVGLQMMAGSRQEAIALTGDDTFYTGSDSLEEDEDELADELEMAGLDIDELADMDEDERREALEDADMDYWYQIYGNIPDSIVENAWKSRLMTNG